MLKEKIRSGYYLSWIFSACFSLLLFAIAWFWIHPSTEVQFHGILFSNLSIAPFDFSTENPARYRFLSPVIAHAIGLSGKLFYIFPWIMMIAFMTLVQRFSLLGSIPMYVGFIKVTLLSFSFMLFLCLAGPGYVDSVSWLLLMICLLPGLNRIVFVTCLLLVLLNHESSIFAFPGLLLWRYRELPYKKVLQQSLFDLLPVIILYAIFRWTISELTSVRYDFSFYLNRENIIGNIYTNFPLLIKGTFYSFRFAWIFPLLAVSSTIVNKEYRMMMIFLLMIVIPFFQLMIAYDFTRLLALCFPAIVLAFDYLYKQYAFRVVWLGLIIIILNLFLPLFIIGKDTFVKIIG